MTDGGLTARLGERQRDRFGLLLLLLVSSFLITGIDAGRGIRALAAALNLGVIVVGLFSTGLERSRPRSVALAAVCVLSTVGIATLDADSPPGAFAGFAQALVLAVIMGAVLSRILRSSQRVTVQSLLGAISVYFLMGLSFAWVYLGLRGVVDNPVLDPETSALPAYYSFVVLTTLGFGDVTPVGELAKRITVIEAIAGQIFLATLVARLVSMYGQDLPHVRERRVASVDGGEGPNSEGPGTDDRRRDGGEGEPRRR